MKNNCVGVGGSPHMANASIHSLRKIRDTKYFADQRGYETDYLKRKTTKDRELKSKISRLDEDVKAYLKQTGAVSAAAVTLTDADAVNLDYASEVESKIKRLQAKHLANSPVFEKLLASSHKDLMRIHSGTASGKSTNNEFSSVEALNLQQSHQPQQGAQGRYSSSALTIAGTPYKSPQFQSKQNVGERCVQVEGRWDPSNSMQEDTVIARILESSFENNNIDSNTADQRQQRRKKQDDKHNQQDLNQDSIEDLMDVDESECESRKASKKKPQTYLDSAVKHQYLSPRRQIYLSPQHQNNNSSAIKTTTANSNSAKTSHHNHHHHHHQNSGQSNPQQLNPSSTPTSHFINTNSPNAHYLKPNLGSPGNSTSNFVSNLTNINNGNMNLINKTATQATASQSRNALNAGSFNSFAVNNYPNNNLISINNMSNPNSSSSLIQNGSNVRNKISSLLIQNNNSNLVQNATSHHRQQNNRATHQSSLQQQTRMMPQDLLTPNNNIQIDSKQQHHSDANSLSAGYSASYNYNSKSHKDSQFSFQNTSPLVQQQQQSQSEQITSSPGQSQPVNKAIVEQYFLSEIEKQNDLVQQQQRQIVLYQQQLQQQTIEFQLFLQEQQLLQARQQLLQQQQQQQQKQLLISSQVGLNSPNGLFQQFQGNQQQQQQQPTPIVINNNISKDHFLPQQQQQQLQQTQQQQQYLQQLQQSQQFNQQLLQPQQILQTAQQQQQFSFMQGNQSNRTDLTVIPQEGFQQQQQQQYESNDKYNKSQQNQASRSASQQRELQQLNDQSSRSNRLEDFQSAENHHSNNNQQSFASSFAYNPNRAGSSQRRKWDVSQRAGTASESMDDDALSCRSKEESSQGQAQNLKLQDVFAAKKIDLQRRLDNEKISHQQGNSQRNAQDLSKEDLLEIRRQFLKPKAHVGNNNNGTNIQQSNELGGSKRTSNISPSKGINHNNTNNNSPGTVNASMGGGGIIHEKQNVINNNNNNKNGSDDNQAITSNNAINISADNKNNNNQSGIPLNAMIPLAPVVSFSNPNQNLIQAQQNNLSNQNLNNVNMGNNISNQLNNINQQDWRTNQQYQQKPSEIINNNNNNSLQYSNNINNNNSNNINIPSLSYSNGNAFQYSFNNSIPSIPPPSIVKDTNPPQVYQFPALATIPAATQPFNQLQQQQPQIQSQISSNYLQNSSSYAPLSQQPAFQPYVNPLLYPPSHFSISNS